MTFAYRDVCSLMAKLSIHPWLFSDRFVFDWFPSTPTQFPIPSVCYSRAMASLSAASAKAQCYANRRRVLEAELREVKTKQRFWDNEVAKHVRKAEKADLLSDQSRKPGKPKVTKTVTKAAVCTPYNPTTCNACRRRVMGLPGGKAHTCGKIKWHR